MMNSKEAIFTIELPDGQVFTGAAMAVEISQEQPVGEVCGRYDSETSLFSAGPAVWEIELRVIGPLTAFDDLQEVIGTEMGVDWTCPYCGRSWPHSQRTCWDGVQGCHANRPAMWWI